jgi:hypothetical protein
VVVVVDEEVVPAPSLASVVTVPVVVRLDVVVEDEVVPPPCTLPEGRERQPRWEPWPEPRPDGR